MRTIQFFSAALGDVLPARHTCRVSAVDMLDTREGIPALNIVQINGTALVEHSDTV